MGPRDGLQNEKVCKILLLTWVLSSVVVYLNNHKTCDIIFRGCYHAQTFLFLEFLKQNFVNKERTNTDKTELSCR